MPAERLSWYRMPPVKRDQDERPAAMGIIRTITEVEYPERDGRPMGETDLHRNWMIRLLDILKYRYRGQQVYVACDLLVYFEEGEPTRFVVPDEFVVKDCDPGQRRVFKTWEEGKVPHCVIEVTSRGTRNQDTSRKPELYAQIGVKELFLYDPTSEYLSPPLQGFRLHGNRYQPIECDEAGRLESQELAIQLHLESGQLVLTDRRTGQVLLTESEAERQARQAAEVRAAEAEARAADQTRARQAAEEELERLREQFRRGPQP